MYQLTAPEVAVMDLKKSCFVRTNDGNVHYALIARGQKPLFCEVGTVGDGKVTIDPKSTIRKPHPEERIIILPEGLAVDGIQTES